MSKALTYGLGIYIIVMVLKGVVGILLPFLPFLVPLIIISIPVLGLLRMIKRTKFRLRKALIWIRRTFSFRKGAISLYLVTGVLVGFFYDQIAFFLIEGILWSIGGFLIGWGVWEIVRVGLRLIKNVQIPSYFQAIKASY